MVECLGVVDLESEFWATDATLAYASNDLDRCERSAWSGIHCDLTFGASLTSSPLSVVPISNSKARALQVLAAVRRAASTNNYDTFVRRWSRSKGRSQQTYTFSGSAI